MDTNWALRRKCLERGEDTVEKKAQLIDPKQGNWGEKADGSLTNGMQNMTSRFRENNLVIRK